ncbi:MAG: leucyl aminopeptidase family protein [Xanthomonadales bacterium]|nr:leucyl aminopeptidase family protein [Xanthomonadales bacterium]MCB1642126.1 leucyl aminopeptidase family protein [Xanthomonadales bacterium]
MSRLIAAADAACPIHLLQADQFDGWRDSLPSATRHWVSLQRFRAATGEWLALPDEQGRLSGLAQSFDPRRALWTLAGAADSWPLGSYQLPADLDADTREAIALGFLMGGYRYTRYSGKAPEGVSLVVADAALRERVEAIASAWQLGRDLVNTPTEDLGPEQLADKATEIGHRFDAGVRVHLGDALAQQFPAIHAVGRASHRAPRLLELDWGQPQHPLVTLVGKGVCFDTGGLDIKGADGMALMKKDMGGAAVALSLAQLIMQTGLPVRLKLLLPLVENAIGPDAYRPGEVIRTRAGLTVEIGNTDAEGRVVLCDALNYAGESQPELLLDFATLTGAARVALGPDLPALFSDDEALADGLLAGGRASSDPLWRMPLWDDYLLDLASPIADLNNAGSSRMAGAITAALYLKRFVKPGTAWAHLDTYCWTGKPRPGRPVGGEVQGLRAAFAYLEWRYRSGAEERR